MEEEQFEEEDEIHCMEDKGSAAFLTLENPAQKVVVPTEQHNIRQRRPAADPVILKAPAQEVRGPDKSPSPFSFESKVQKLKIALPLLEIVKSEVFRKPILDALEMKATQTSTDYVNLQDDKPAVFLSPMTEPADDNSPSFYVSLTIYDKILHNCLLDTGDSHNLMPKAVMDVLGLDITKPYHDLFSFDSRKVKCLGLIRDLAITLTQLPMKSMVMDIVVVDVPPKFGILLFRGWIKRLGGTLQNDLSYAIVPVFGGESRRLYREARLAYIISNEENPSKHPIYAVDTDFGACILQIEESQKASMQIKKPVNQAREEKGSQVWEMFFDGTSSRETAGAGVVLISPKQESTHLSFKLAFQVTNNVAEYEALILGLSAAKDKGIRNIEVFGDADLIIQQVNRTFQAKHPRLKAYRDEGMETQSDLKTYDKEIIQHKIPLEKDIIHFKQKLRPINPLLLPLIEKEIKKLLATKIIVRLRYSKWVANLVVVRKKSGEIRLGVDFKNLKKCSKKDNYPLPKMAHLLQKVSGAKVMSFLDGFLG
eukprot:PITA_35945